LQGQYGPQVAQQQYDLAAQYGPMYRALIEQQFPQIGLLSNQVSQRLASPGSLTVEQQAAQDAIRGRAFEQSERGIRQSANVGGTLYGGQRELREDRARNELAQGFATQDIQLQQQQRQQAMSELATLFQLAFPNVQQPGQIGLNTGVSDPTNALYNALVQNAGNFGIIPGTAGSPSPLWGLAGQGAGAAGAIGMGQALAGAKILVFCLPGTTLIDTPEGQMPIEEIHTEMDTKFSDGSTARILMKYEYAKAPVDLVSLEFESGASIELSQPHLLHGKPAGAYRVGEDVGGERIVRVTPSVRQVKTYDLFTNATDGEYTSSGIRIQSMIPFLHTLASQLQEVA